MLQRLSIVYFLIISTLTIGIAKEPIKFFEDAVEAYNKKDYFIAFDLFDKLCKDGNLFSCNNLGILYDNGYGTRQSYQKARELYMKLCDQNIAIGCYNVGSMYLNEAGVTYNRQKILEFIGKGCDLKDTLSCTHYSLINTSPPDKDIYTYLSLQNSMLHYAASFELKSRRFISKD